MRPEIRLALSVTLLGILLLACGSPRSSREARATQIAAQIFATQTADARAHPPTATHTATSPPTATSTATPTPTTTSTATPTPTAMPTATLTPEPTPAADLPTDWPLVLSDPFADNAHDWPVGTERDEYATNNRRIVDGLYRWQIQAHQDVFWEVHPSQSTLSDLYVAVDVRQVSGPLDSSHGLVFRMQDIDNFYLFGISEQQQYVLLCKYRGEWTHLVGWTFTSAIRPGDVNHVAVAAQGNRLRCYVNDQLVAEVDDDHLSQGRAGLAIELYRAGEEAILEFDNWLVRAP